ncbi:polysaccharide biosynthesis tyrosine autokinase [Micromonospora sp. WMMD882]|uniref:polysaccharide biosynthesis tyrosine autokinase n=1 Tax=Micromonospora sp. WMMD882 TaxID=3015151 RepID=UPI00248B9906|nr:polysaccharide biosynthesis tyrosine autokinase [Micromonospora sp. WMMD882]WBB80851.1 polysaccharide biosynthesis tyrosine autokinase [Micromonospora sp. WMMD882]
MDLRSYVLLVRRQWWIVLVTVVAALGAAGYLTVRAEPRYQATVTFFVTTPSQGVTDAYQGSLWLQQRVKSYADLLRSERLARVIAEDRGLGLSADGVRARLDTSVQTGTVLLRATVTDTDRTRALKVAEALSVKFVDLVQKVETPPDGRLSIKLEVVSGPRVGTDPVSPRPDRNLLLGLLAGLIAGVALAIGRGMSDNRLRDVDTLRRITDSPLLGVVPFEAAARTDPLIVGDAANSARAEAVRKIRTNLRFVDVHEPARIIAVTSALQGEGKTTLSCNLGIALAEAGWRVLLVDADLRRPRVAEYLGLESAVGLTDVLLGDVPVGDAVQRWGDRSLLVLPSGSNPPNPSELLGSKAMAELLTSLRESADIVIIDTAPLLAVTDGVVVAVQADGALMVTQQGRISRTQVSAASRALQSVSVRILGCVLNMAKVDKREAYQYEAYRVVVSSRSVPADRAAARRAGEDRVPADNATQELTRLPR